MRLFSRFSVCIFLITASLAFGQKVGVVDVQKVFDGYQKVKEAREKLEKSQKIAMEELEIFRDELEKIVKELKEMEDKLKNPNIDSSSLKSKYQEKYRWLKKSRMIWLHMTSGLKQRLLKDKETSLLSIWKT